MLTKVTAAVSAFDATDQSSAWALERVPKIDRRGMAKKKGAKGGGKGC